MKLKNKLLLGVSALSLSMGALGMQASYVDNEEVKGTNGRVVSGVDYNIIEKVSGRALYGNYAGNKVEKFPPQEDGGAYSKWSLHWVEGSYYNIIEKVSGRALYGNYAGNNKNNHYKVEKFPPQEDGGAYSKWSFIPQNYQLKAVIKDFQYHDKIYNLNNFAQKSSSVSWSHTNHATGGNPDQMQVNINEKIRNFSSWSFTESHERQFFNKLDVGIEAEYAGVKGHVNNTTEWKNTDKTLEETKKENLDETQVGMSDTVSIPPKKRVELVIDWFKVNVDVPFTATVDVRGFADRIKTNGGRQYAQVDRTAVKSFLMHQGFNVQSITGSAGKSILAKIAGNVKVEGATRGEIHKYEYDI